MTAARSTPAPAQVIAGRYRIEAKLGEGGMGSVWRAQHLTLRSPVAIKLIDPSLTSSEEAIGRFLLEAQAAAALRSPHVVQILDHGVDKGVPYIAMELLEGESLSDRLKRRFALTPAETARIMTHTARAMSKAHAAGVVHRDLKPDNIFLVRNEDEEIAKVLDFGIAKATSNAATTSTRTGMMLGTSYYMSPEQIEGSKVTDHRTDLWAMAAITFECLIGERAFDGETVGAVLLKICAKPIPVPSELGPVPPGFDEWFARATARAPSERFQSAREMADALRAVLTPGQGQTLQAMPPTSTLVTTNAAISKLSNSGVVVREASTSPEMAMMPTIPPPSVTPRSSRQLPLLIAGGCIVAVLAVAALLLRGGPSDEQQAAAKEQSAQPTQETKPAAPPQPAPAPVNSAAPAPLQQTAPAPSPSAAPGQTGAVPAQASAAPAQAGAPAPARISPTKPAARPQPKRPVRKAPDLGF